MCCLSAGFHALSTFYGQADVYSQILLKILSAYSDYMRKNHSKKFSLDHRAIELFLPFIIEILKFLPMS